MYSTTSLLFLLVQFTNNIPWIESEGFGVRRTAQKYFESPDTPVKTIQSVSETQCVLQGKKVQGGGYSNYHHKSNVCDIYTENSDGKVSSNNEYTLMSLLHQTQSVWRLATDKPVCFGATGKTPGVFTVQRSGLLTGIRLQHTSGGVTCHYLHPKLTPFGCDGVNWYRKELLGVFVTNHKDETYFPPPARVTHVNAFYSLPGYNAFSRQVTIEDLDTPHYIEGGQQLKLWYGEDLFNIFQTENSGLSCVNVYLQF